MKTNAALFAAAAAIALALQNSVVFAQSASFLTGALASDPEVAELVFDSMLGGLDGRSWVFTSDSGIDAELSARAKARGIDLVTIPSRAASREDAEKFIAAAKALGSPRLEAAAHLRPELFVLAWFAERPAEAAAKLAFLMDFHAPAVAGLALAPNGGVYIVCASNELGAARLGKFAAAYRAVREEAGELLPFRSAPEGASPGAETFLRRTLSINGNNLGALLYNAGQKEDAFALFQLAHTIDAASFSPVLNMASIAREGVRADQAPKILAQLEAWGKAGAQSWALAQTSGVVLRPEEFFPANWWWAASGFGHADRARLEAAVEKAPDGPVRAALEKVAQSRPHLDELGAQIRAMLEAPDFQAPPSGRFLADCARRHLVAGDTGRAAAAAALAEAAAGAADPAAPEMLARLKASLLAASGDIAASVTALEDAKTAENAAQILEAIAAARFTAGDSEAFRKAVGELAALTNAPTWAAAFAAAVESDAKGDSAAALASADKALETGSDKILPVTFALNTAFKAGDLARGDRYAAALLALNPRDYLANFTRASAMEQARKLPEAECFYLAAAAANPTWVVLNNLAALMTETGKTEPAMKFAEQSLKAGGDEHAAVWDTYATLLRKAGRRDEAKTAYKNAAEKPGGDDPRIQLNLAEIALEDGDKETARKALPLIDAGKDAFTIEERERLGRIRSQLR